MSELEQAFDNGFETVSYYLDLETGEVVCVTDEERGLLERITESYYDEQSQTADWETAFEEEDIPDWHREPLQDAGRVEAGFGSRFIPIPAQDSHEGYSDMEAFIDTVSNSRLQERLEDAISGRGAFRRFKDVFLEYPAERERWFQFQRERLHQRMLDWLEEQEITPLQ
jgi:hypothetical protein